MGIKSIPMGFGLGAAFHLAGFRNPFKNGLRSPITPISNIKKLFTDRSYAKEIGNLSLTDALYGAGMGAASGAIYPILSHKMHVSDKALDEARKVMEENPYVTSLPAGEMLSMIKQKKDEAPNDVRNTIKNVGLGTAIGAITGLAGGLTPTATRMGFGSLRNAFNRVTNRPIQKLITPAIRDSLKTDAITSSAFGGVMGGFSGMFTKNLIEDENQNLHNNQT
jgi:ABC-type nitrate/sulfonate/bicarbonate transport system permease component